MCDQRLQARQRLRTRSTNTAAAPRYWSGSRSAANFVRLDVTRDLRVVRGHLRKRRPSRRRARLTRSTQSSPRRGRGYRRAPSIGLRPAPRRRSRRGSARMRVGVHSQRRRGGGDRVRRVDGERTSAGSVSHSACQPPARARAPAASRPGSSRPAPAPARRGDRAHRRRTGFCLCGIVEEPPAPLPAFRTTSPTSVCASSVEIAADLSERAADQAEPTCQTSTRRSRCVCHGHVRSTQRQPARQRSATAGRVRQATPAFPTRRRAAATMARSKRLRGRSRPRDHVEPTGDLQTQRDRRRLLQPRAAGHGRRLVTPRFDRGGQHCMRERVVKVDAFAAKLQHERRVEQSWLVAPRWTAGRLGLMAATSSVSRRMSGIAMLPAATASRARAARSK